MVGEAGMVVGPVVQGPGGADLMEGFGLSQHGAGVLGEAVRYPRDLNVEDWVDEVEFGGLGSQGEGGGVDATDRGGVVGHFGIGAPGAGVGRRGGRADVSWKMFGGPAKGEECWRRGGMQTGRKNGRRGRSCAR